MKTYFQLNQQKASRLWLWYLIAFSVLCLTSVWVLWYFFTLDSYILWLIGIGGPLIFSAALIAQALVLGKYQHERKMGMYRFPPLASFFKEFGFNLVEMEPESRFDFVELLMVGYFMGYRIQAIPDEENSKYLLFHIEIHTRPYNETHIKHLAIQLIPLGAYLMPGKVVWKAEALKIRSSNEWSERLEKVILVLRGEGLFS